MNNDFFYLAGKKFSSRLILGSGKFPDNKIFKKVIEQTQTEMITVALRRVDVKKAETDDILKNIDRKKITVLLNTSGAKEASQAVKIARIGRESGLTDWIKIEVINDMKYLMPDPVETLKACEILVKEGFKVMPYIGNDPVLCRKLEDAGCICVMPLGSPIGSGRGIDNSYNLDIIVENSKIPVIVDAGIGKPSHAASVMEIG
ncbi:MAG: thiazole synthase, partial [Candidatus Muiribacteriota bacterium]